MKKLKPKSENSFFYTATSRNCCGSGVAGFRSIESYAKRQAETLAII